MTKFSTNSLYILSILISCIVFINYQAISQDTIENYSAIEVDSISNDSLQTQEDKKIIYHFKLFEDIMPNASRLIRSVVEQAEEVNADIIVMELNTYGGRVDIADTIKSILLGAKPLTVSYIVNNAISAGAFISIACDSIYMKEEATIGAVTVVNGTDGQAMPDKYQAVMRAKMRATAELQGRDPDIAEAMVDDRVAIPGIIDSGKTLTFTANEALEHNYCDGIVRNLDEVIEALGLEDVEVIEHQLTAVDKIIGFLLNPAVSSILMLMIFGGIYFELQTPGIGFPLAAAIIGATLFFAPLYLQGLAASWEVILFFVGIAFLAVEIFVLPGFGVAGILGLLLIVSSLTFSLVQNDAFDFTFTGWDEIGKALLRVMLTLTGGIAFMVAFGGSLFSTPAFKRITLTDEQRAEDGYAIRKIELDHLIGSTGKAITDLRTTGKVEIDGEIYDALSESSFIDLGTEVKVLSIDVNTLVVRKTS